MKLVTVSIFLGVVSSVAQEASYSERMEALRALAEWSGFVREVQESGNDGNLARLGLGLRKTTKPSIYPVDERIEVHAQLRDVMISIPGHADYFASRLEEARNGEDVDAHGEPLGTYQRERAYTFQTLAELPSPETVRVLGEFLYDDRDWREMPENPSLDDVVMAQPNFSRAIEALHALLENPPMPLSREDMFYKDVETWRLWYEQVKAGNRTFRFKGDPQEYTLEGPAPVRLEPSVGRTTDRPKAAAAGGQVSAEETPVVPGVALIVTSILLVGALGYYIRSRRRS